MRIVVEPQDGRDLDRLVTALLNATGVVHRAIEDSARPRRAEGLEVVELVADRIHGSLTLLLRGSGWAKIVGHSNGG